MKEEIRGLYSPIRKEYWKKIPKERADEAVMACKQKYSSGDYAFFRVAFLGLMVPFFMFLKNFEFRFNDLSDIICSVGVMLLLLGCGLFLPVGLLLEYKITVHKIKTGKAWIKSGKILKIEKKVGKNAGKNDRIFYFFCQEGHNEEVYERNLRYINSRKVIEGQDVTVVVVNEELIILDQYYPEYAGKEGTVFVRDNPKVIQIIEHYMHDILWYELCQEIWDRFVPDTGKSKALQGELLRLAEFLRTIAEENNENWNAECEEACDFLEHYLVYDEEYSVSDKNEMQQIIFCIRKRGRNKEAYENLILFDCIEDEITDIYIENEEPIDYHYSPGGWKDWFWEEEIKPQETGTVSKKRKEKIVGGIVAVIGIVLFFGVFYLMGRNILDDQNAEKAASGIMLDVPVVQVDGNTLEVGGEMFDICESGYECMSESGKVYFTRDWVRIAIDPMENAQLYVVKEVIDRKKMCHSFKKTGLKVTVTNTGEQTDVVLNSNITKIVIDERENLSESVLVLDGIETQNLDRNTAVKELQQTGVKFKEEDTKKFVNGEIDRLVSDSANYRYTIKASQDDKQVVLEIECLEQAK